jgi:hypothetical protein
VSVLKNRLRLASRTHSVVQGDEMMGELFLGLHWMKFTAFGPAPEGHHVTLRPIGDEVDPLDQCLV